MTGEYMGEVDSIGICRGTIGKGKPGEDAVKANGGGIVTAFIYAPGSL